MLPTESCRLTCSFPSLYVAADRFPKVVKYKFAIRPEFVPLCLLHLEPGCHVPVDWEGPVFLSFGLFRVSQISPAFRSTWCHFSFLSSPARLPTWYPTTNMALRWSGRALSRAEYWACSMNPS